MAKYNLGRFDMTKGFVDLLNEDPLLFERVCSNFLVVRCEYIFDKKLFRYSAFSPLFRGITESEMIPKYKIYVTGGDKLGNPEFFDYIVSVKEEEK